MKDVAAVAGVSLSTVSRVVNGAPPVAPELAARVERAVEMLGYRHNHTAGALRRANGLSHSLGLVVEDVSLPFCAAVHRGVEEIARERGVITFAGSSDGDSERERALIERVLSRRVDGVIVAGVGEDYTYLLRDVAAGIGVVFIDRPPRGIDADHVLGPERDGLALGRTAAELLFSRLDGFSGPGRRVVLAAPEPAASGR
jgi:LacI family transcriptional regulator